ncbi:MAG: hypothetical protein HQM08_02290 [Candidatus Riflebacteria bacterium]|nr:hypothetical protein [Candidatus Riflebacteria bacterium]
MNIQKNVQRFPMMLWKIFFGGLKHTYGLIRIGITGMFNGAKVLVSEEGFVIFGQVLRLPASYFNFTSRVAQNSFLPPKWGIAFSMKFA